MTPPLSYCCLCWLKAERRSIIVSKWIQKPGIIGPSKPERIHVKTDISRTASSEFIFCSSKICFGLQCYFSQGCFDHEFVSKPSYTNDAGFIHCVIKAIVSTVHRVAKPCTIKSPPTKLCYTLLLE